MTGADIVVVGGGLAGRIVALAARKHDSTTAVTLLGGSNWSFDGESGLVDVLGYTPDGSGPVSDPFEAIERVPTSHPYRVVGAERLRDGLAVFDDAVGRMYCGESTDANALVPTSFGRLRPTARYPRSVAAGLASQPRETTLVGFEFLPEYDAPPAAERLEDVVPYRVNGTTVQFPTDDRTRTAMAETLDENPTPAGGAPAREALAATVQTHQTGETRIGLPPVLGLGETATVREQFETAFGVPVFEVPAGPPSVPGLRLGQRLETALGEAGVTVRPNGRVRGFEATDGRIDRLRLQDGSEIAGTQYVLATGGLASGGITSDRAGVTEAVFDCHVDAPEKRSEWAKAEPLGSHPFARFGVGVDEGLRPLDDAGVCEYGNLRAAGRVIGGFDPVAENSGGGVAVATGYAAGRFATDDC